MTPVFDPSNAHPMQLVQLGQTPPRPTTHPLDTSIIGRDTSGSRKSLRINERVLPGAFHAGSAGARKASTLWLPGSPNERPPDGAVNISASLSASYTTDHESPQ
jgi:hypothetical protein